MSKQPTTDERAAILAAIMEQVRALPQKPGVYRFFDENGKLLYIGKAIRLRSRVQSYFRTSTDHSAAKQYMVWQIRTIEHTVVTTEAEALLLETTLIKRHKPPYNIVMKDDKNFQYIHITAEAFPKIETVRQLPLPARRSGLYFGPYTSGFAVKRTLRMLQTVFRYCTMPPEQKGDTVVYPKRPCLQYQLGRCVGPCAQAVTAEEYQVIMKQIASVLRGDFDAVAEEITKRMQAASKAKLYEKATEYRDQLASIDAMLIDQKVVDARGLSADFLSLSRVNDTAAVNLFIVRHGRLIAQNVFILRHVKDQSDDDVLAAFRNQYYTQSIDVPPTIITNIESRRGKNRKLLEMGEENALHALEQHLASFEKEEKRAQEGLTEIAAALSANWPTAGKAKSPLFTAESLKRIEIYDISHQQGAYTVGSMVVFVNGRPAPSEYRKFKIRSARGTGKSNDFASLQEVMNRRIKHLSRNGKQAEDAWPKPDLFIIDGGKGQLSAVKAILDAGNITIPVTSLAKREEELFMPHTTTPILLPRNSQGYFLLQRMRDEAHRFAIGFYRRRHLAGLV